MRIDYLKTLDPSLGIARSATLFRPDGDRNPLWTLAVDIGQDEFAKRSADEHEYTLSLVGAADIRRAQVYARAAGEAVERWALKPPSLRTELRKSTLDGGLLWRRTAARGLLPVYPARLSLQGRELDVVAPAAAVDYPVSRNCPDGFDPSPSGAAAGAGHADALDRACREVLERDAAMRSWYADDALPQINLQFARRENRDLDRLITLFESLGLEYAVVSLTSTSPDVRPMMAMLIDRRNQLAAAGLGLERDHARSAARAMQESLQVRTVLNRRAPSERVAPPDVVEDDAARARYWSSPAGVAAAGRWMARVQPAASVAPRSEDVRWSQHVGRRAVVDLTPRLPTPIADMGWSVVKVLAPDLLPLRMSEAADWTLRGPMRDHAETPHPFV